MEQVQVLIRIAIVLGCVFAAGCGKKEESSFQLPNLSPSLGSNGAITTTPAPKPAPQPPADATASPIRVPEEAPPAAAPAPAPPPPVAVAPEAAPPSVAAPAPARPPAAKLAKRAAPKRAAPPPSLEDIEPAAGPSTGSAPRGIRLPDTPRPAPAPLPKTRDPSVPGWMADGTDAARRPPPRATAARPPTETAAAAPPVVYNADLSPQLEREPDAPRRPVLKAGEATALRFDIGPPWTTSVLAPIAPPPEILNSKDDVPLSVVLVCGFCAGQGDSLQHVTYRVNDRRSNEVRFTFTPKADPRQPNYVGALQLLVMNDRTGVEHDRLAIEVAVRGEVAAASGDAGGPIAITASRPQGTSAWMPDVILYVMREAGNDISFEVRPVGASTAAAIGPMALGADSQPRRFRTGIGDDDLLKAMTSAYGAMSGVAEQGELLRQLRARGADAAVSEDAQQSLTLNARESAEVTKVLATIGQRLYRVLFVDGGAHEDLEHIMRQLDRIAAAQPADRPLRVKIVTDRIALPWQYLLPMGEPDPQRFWGLRFSLNVERASSHDRSNTAAGGADSGKVLFARYASSADPTFPLAATQIEQLRKLPVQLVEVDSGSRLLDTLKVDRGQISTILTFLHATSGLRAAPGTMMADPALLFNDGDIVTSVRLDDLRNGLTAEEARKLYLQRAPLVILNACETGPSLALPHVTLEDALFRLGARGVVVTEVSIWVQLGHEMATRLITRLGRGESVSDALTAIRRELFNVNHNPLGLLYAYHGEPSATLRR